MELFHYSWSSCFFPPFNFLLPIDEREAVQKKTFTKWVNSILSRVGCRISDLYLDLRDGRMLIKLLEVLSGERLVRSPTSPVLRFVFAFSPFLLFVPSRLSNVPCLCFLSLAETHQGPNAYPLFGEC